MKNKNSSFSFSFCSSDPIHFQFIHFHFISFRFSIIDAFHSWPHASCFDSITFTTHIHTQTYEKNIRVFIIQIPDMNEILVVFIPLNILVKILCLFHLILRTMMARKQKERKDQIHNIFQPLLSYIRQCPLHFKVLDPNSSRMNYPNNEEEEWI